MKVGCCRVKTRFHVKIFAFFIEIFDQIKYTILVDHLGYASFDLLHYLHQINHFFSLNLVMIRVALRYEIDYLIALF